MDEEKIDTFRSAPNLPFHYYGDIVRRLFILSAIIMVVTLPFLTSSLPVSPLVSILVIVLLSLTAGLLAPRNRWVISVNLLVSLAAVIAFEYCAVDAYQRLSFDSLLFLVNQVLAIIFVFALYYASKTIRSIFNKEY